MSHEPDVDRTVSVSDDDVRVEKSFARDEFPVPAIKFRLVSESEDPVHVRLIDRIPEDFPMEGIGFHPDYGSDDWTAYKDHRVEYERSLKPGESTTTVYGIRLDESVDVAGFLGEPILERPPVPGEAPEDRPGADVDDILGTDRSQLVRDALQGNGRLANQESPDRAADDPGVEPIAEPPADGDGEPTDRDPEPVDGDAEPAIEPAADADADDADTDDTGRDDADAPEPRAVPSALTAVVRRATESVTPVASGGAEADAEDTVAAASADDAEPEADAESSADVGGAAAPEGDTDSDPDGDPDADIEGGSDPDADTEGDPTADTDEYVDIGAEAGDSGVAAAPAPDAEGGLAATLAAEIRAGEVSEADVETLRGELDPGLPRSADVRIRRLQSQLADLETYSDAIKEFIDDEGTGAELVERLDAELESVTTELDDLRDGLDAAADDRETIRTDVDALGDDLASTDDRLDAVDETATTAADDADDAHDRADVIEDHLADVESDIDNLTEALDDLTDDIDDVAAEVGDVAADLDDTDDYVSRVDDDLDEVRGEVAAVDDDVTDARESLSADIADLRAEVTALTDELERVDGIESEIEELQTFRDRLSSAFGPSGGGEADADEE